MKKSRRNQFLDQLCTIPNVSLACEKTGLSRNTIYRWRGEDEEFKKEMDAALKAGVETINDLAESKLISHINNGSMRAIEYWLTNHKKAYVRPKPKDFWDDLLGKIPVTSINILPPLPPSQAQAEHLEKIRKEREEGQHGSVNQ